MTITDGHGSWGGVGTLPPNGGGGSVALVDGSHNTICEAHLPSVS